MHKKNFVDRSSRSSKKKNISTFKIITAFLLNYRWVTFAAFHKSKFFVSRDLRAERGKALSYIPSTGDRIPSACIRAMRTPALPECLTQRLECQIKMQRLLRARVEGDKEVGICYRGFQNKIIWFSSTMLRFSR